MVDRFGTASANLLTYLVLGTAAVDIAFQPSRTGSLGAGRAGSKVAFARSASTVACVLVSVAK